MGGSFYLQNTNVSINSSKFFENQAIEGKGGAIYDYSETDDQYFYSQQNIWGDNQANEGSLIMFDGVMKNITFDGDDIKNNFAIEGSTILFDIDSKINFINSRFYNNSALEGSCFTCSNIHNLRNNTRVIINNSSFDSNVSLRRGSIYSTHCSLTIDSSSFSSNKARDGASIYSIFDENQLHIITNSNFSSNCATNNGGAIYLDVENTFNFALSILNCSFSSNQAFSNGGSLFLKYLEDFLDKGLTLEIYNSKFFNDSCLSNGGSLHFETPMWVPENLGKFFILKSNHFLNCSSVNGNGGAISIFNNFLNQNTTENTNSTSSLSFLIVENIFENCYSDKGGGGSIFWNPGQETNFNHKEMNSILSLNNFSTKFDSLYGNFLGTPPFSLCAHIGDFICETKNDFNVIFKDFEFDIYFLVKDFYENNVKYHQDFEVDRVVVSSSNTTKLSSPFPRNTSK